MLQDHVPFAIKPNAISTTLHVGSSQSSPGSESTPIAFVYTPTMRPHQSTGPSDVYDRNPVLLPSQQPSSSSSSAPSPQNFLAPFFASVSAEVPSRDGWSVVMVKEKMKNGDAQERVSDIDDNVRKSEANSTADTPGDDVNEGLQTESSDFDAENFKPQLFGGFQPILEFPSDSGEVPSELRNKEVVGVVDEQSPRSVDNSRG